MAEFATLQHATYTEAEWTAWNGILLAGQIGFSSDALYSGTDQMKYKVGNGTDTWTNLDYMPEPTGFTGGSLTSALNEAKGSDIASASTTDIGAATGNYVKVTGTTTITALGTIQAGTRRIVEFTGILTLTHNGTSLILPTGANITTAAGDVATFVSLGSGNWKCVNYMRADGSSLAGGTKTYGTEMYAVASGTDTYTATLSPAPTAYTTGMQVRIKIPNANTVTNPTLNLNSLGAKTIKALNSTALQIGAFSANGDYLFVYDGTDFILQAGIQDRKDVNYYKRKGTTAPERWYTSCDKGAVISTAARARNQYVAVPVIFSEKITLDRIGAEITSIGDAASLVRLGIYADNGNVYPGSLVLDAGTIAGDSATAQAITINQTLESGLYWFVYVHNSVANITFRVSGAVYGVLGFASTIGATPGSVIIDSAAYSTLPSTFTTGITPSSQATPLITFRASS